MRSQVAQRTGAGGRCELTPGCRGVRVSAVRAVELAAEGDKVAQLARVHQFLGQYVGRALGVNEVNQALDACLFDSVYHRLAFSQGICHRLFAQDVLAGLSCRNGNLCVGEVRGCDDDQLDLRIIDDIVPVGGYLLIAKALSRELGGSLVNICNMLKYGLYIVIRLTDIVQADRVEAAHPVSADQADFYLLHNQ